MIEVKVAGIAIDTSDQHVVLLTPAENTDENGPLMPIWVGSNEASAILIGAGHLGTPRPMTHDLIYAMLESLDTVISKVEITSLSEGTFLAVIHMQSTLREHIIDARPSDAIAIAVRTGSPIFVSKDVFDSSAMTQFFDPEPEEQQESEQGQNTKDALKDFQNFKDFLENVNPEDFERGADE